MYREKVRIYYTEEDKKNLVVRKYLESELAEIKGQYKKKQNRRRIIYAIIILILILCSFLFESIKYISDLALCFMIFLVFTDESADRTNIKALSCEYYVEVQIEKKLPREAEIEGTATPGSDVTSFFPIEGRDTTSGYRSIFYIEMEQYLDTDVGGIVRISTMREKL